MSGEGFGEESATDIGAPGVRLPAAQPALFVAIVVLASVVSHAPGDVRYHSFLHRRRIGPEDVGPAAHRGDRAPRPGG